MNEFLQFVEGLSLFGIFVTMAVVGVLVFTVAFVFDGLFDFDLGDVPLVQLFGVFLGTAGGTGLVTLGLGNENPLLTGLIAAGVGILLSALFAVLVSKLQTVANQEFELDTSKVVGSVVPVSWWKATEGEVLVRLGGNLFKVTAVSEEELVNTGSFRVKSADFQRDKLVKVHVENV